MPHIVLTGTESTYKTRLCLALSEKFDVPMVQEYARQYMSEKALNAQDLNETFFNAIAAGQIEQQRSNGYFDADAKPILFDTDGLTLAVWASDKFHRSTSEFTAIPSHLHYLVCAPTTKAYQDPMRSDLHRRVELHQHYLAILNALGASYTILHKVDFNDRLQEAVDALRAHGFKPRD